MAMNRKGIRKVENFTKNGLLTGFKNLVFNGFSNFWKGLLITRWGCKKQMIVIFKPDRKNRLQYSVSRSNRFRNSCRSGFLLASF